MPQPRVQSLDRALDLLEALAGADELGVSEIAAQTGLVPSTAHRLLGTLVARGYAAQSPTSGRYLLGYKLLELTSGAAGPARQRLRTAARPHLEAIQARDRRDDQPGRARGPRRRLRRSASPGTRSVRLFTEIGRAIPAHTSGAGKALLAWRDPADVDALLGGAPLRALDAAHADDARRRCRRTSRDPPPRLQHRQRGARARRRVRRDADLRPRRACRWRRSASPGRRRASCTPTRRTSPACCASTPKRSARALAGTTTGVTDGPARRGAARGLSATRPAGPR